MYKQTIAVEIAGEQTGRVDGVDIYIHGKVNREDYVDLAKEAAEQENAYFIELNKLIADEYDVLGQTKVSEMYFGATDHTHTVKEGAIFNARKVAEGIKATNGLKLAKYLK